MAKRRSKATTAGAHQRIDDHEKLCRIMQKQTCQKIEQLHQEINGIKRILIIAAGGIISGLFTIVLMLVSR